MNDPKSKPMTADDLYNEMQFSIGAAVSLLDVLMGLFNEWSILNRLRGESFSTTPALWPSSQWKRQSRPKISAWSFARPRPRKRRGKSHDGS